MQRAATSWVKSICSVIAQIWGWAAGDLAVSAIKAADLVLISMQPLPYYICATAGLIELAKQRTEVIDGRQRAAFVVSRAIKGTRISAEIVDALRGYGLPILAFWITQGVAYYSTTVAGTTVLNGEPNGDGAAEIRALGPRCVPYSPERMSEPTLSAGRPSRSAGSKAATQASLAERPAMAKLDSRHRPE